mgnify:CR=1 FL=1
MRSSSPFPRHRRVHRWPVQAAGDTPRLSARMRPRKNARRTLGSRAHAAYPSHARRRELLDDMRESPVRARIETQDAYE